MRLERMFCLLKHMYMNGKSPRQDVLVKALMEMTSDKLMDRCIKMIRGKTNHKLSDGYQMHRRGLAIPNEDIKIEEGKWTVVSQKTKSDFYVVQKDRPCEERGMTTETDEERSPTPCFLR